MYRISLLNVPCRLFVDGEIFFFQLFFLTDMLGAGLRRHVITEKQLEQKLTARRFVLGRMLKPSCKCRFACGSYRVDLALGPAWLFFAALRGNQAVLRKLFQPPIDAPIALIPKVANAAFDEL